MLRILNSIGDVLALTTESPHMGSMPYELARDIDQGS